MLTQHQHPLPHGGMQVAAPASPTAPEGDVKGLLGVPRARSSRSSVMGEQTQRAQREVASFATLLSTGLYAAGSAAQSVTTATGRASAFPSQTWRPLIHLGRTKVPSSTRTMAVLTFAGAALPVLCGILVLRHHLWHVHGRVRRPRHSEGLRPLLLQRGRGRPVGSCRHGRGWR